MTHLKLVAGTDVTGEPEPIWDAPDGIERVLRAALRQDLAYVCVVGASSDGELYVASNLASVEATIGILARGQMHVHECVSAGIADSSEPEDAE